VAVVAVVVAEAAVRIPEVAVYIQVEVRILEEARTRVEVRILEEG
jgi:hypothetical protein